MKVRPDPKVNKVPRGIRVHRAHLDPRVSKGPRVQQALPVHQDHEGSQAQQVPQEQQALPVSLKS